MCYNATVSAITFLVTAAVCAYLWHRNKGYDHPIALILLFVSLMQLVEWGLWLHLDCGPLHKLLSACIPLLLYAQPLVINWVVGYYNAGWGAGYNIIAYILVALFGVKAFSVFTNYAKGQTECVTVNNGHLQWSANKNNLPFSTLENRFYALAMLYPLITFKDMFFGLAYALFGLLSLSIFQTSFTTTWPSMWCHFVNALSVLAIASPYVMK